MYEQQDSALRQATADLLRRSPGHELQSPSKRLFQNARETPVSPDASLKPVVDEIIADEELVHANDFWKFFTVPIIINVNPLAPIASPPPFTTHPLSLQILLEVCDDLDRRFVLVPPQTGSVLHFFMTNPCAAIAARFPLAITWFEILSAG
jgi:hypothetical protein